MLSPRTLFSLLFSLFLLAAAVVTSQAEPALTVSGKDLLWDGHPIRLLGVAVGDPLLARKDRPLSDYQQIAKEWHSNVVRIGYHPSVWKRENHRRLLDQLEKEINAAVDQGMFVIIDWHTIGWPDGWYEKPDPAWGDPEDLYDSSLKLAKDYWGAMAARFGKNPHVLFEIWNEPAFSDDEGDGSNLSKWTRLKPAWEQLVQVIRAKSQNVIIASGNEWAYDLRGIRKNLLEGGNIAYAWHVYAGNEDNDARAWTRKLDNLDTVAPVIVTEWGFERGSPDHFRGTPESFGNKFRTAFLEKRKMHNTAWCWHPEWTPTLLKKDWKTPTEFGRFVKSYLESETSVVNTTEQTAKNAASVSAR